MTKADWDFDAIVNAFSTAAADPSKWVDAMEIASIELGGCGSILVPVKGHLVQTPFSRSKPPSFEAGCRSDMDFTTSKSMSQQPNYRGSALVDHEWSANVKVVADDDLWIMSVQRSVSQE